MKPIYSHSVHVQLMPIRPGEWMLAFFDIDQEFTMMYMCSTEELMDMHALIQDTVVDYVKEMDLGEFDAH